MSAEVAIARPSGAPMRLLDLVTVATIAYIFVAKRRKFDDEQWWLGPLVVLAIGWSLWRRGSFWGKPLIAFALFLFQRAYQRYRAQQEIAKSFARLEPAAESSGWDAFGSESLVHIPEA